MYSYVGFLNGNLNITNKVGSNSIFNQTMMRRDDSDFYEARSFYVCQNIFSTLTPNDVPQPTGEIITNDMWENLVKTG